MKHKKLCQRQRSRHTAGSQRQHESPKRADTFRETIRFTPSIEQLEQRHLLASDVATPVSLDHVEDHLQPVGELRNIIDSRLTDVFNNHRMHQGAARAFVEAGYHGPLVPWAYRQSTPLLVSGNKIAIEVIGSADLGTLPDDLQDLGMKIDSVFAPLVAGVVDIGLLDDIAALVSVRSVTPVYETIVNNGAVAGQGNAALNVDAVHGRGITGEGITIGIISNSFNVSGDGSYEDDADSGDLPSNVDIIKDGDTTNDCFSSQECSDEGRAMSQIVHDVAPGATLKFHTHGQGQSGIATAIRALTNAGADIIVDDVSYPNEPIFMDGIIAQIIDQVVAEGVTYFSSAGNQGNRSYDGQFVYSGSTAAFSSETETFFGSLHDFDGTAAIDEFQQVTINDGGALVVQFQWDEPFGTHTGGIGASSNYDIFLVDADNTTANVLARSTSTNNFDPVEYLNYEDPDNAENNSPTVAYLAIVRKSGDPHRLKFIIPPSPDDNGIEQVTINDLVAETTNSTVVGHANAEHTIAIGAARFDTPTQLEPFSSVGVTPILFDADGNSITEINRESPDLVAPDGVATTMSGFSPFFGTSAAAPHAAAVAALVLEAAGGPGSLSPSALETTLEETATDMGDPGHDDETGHGFINALEAVQRLITDEQPPIVVTSLDDDSMDDGQVTLREAIEAANTNMSVDGSQSGDAVDRIVFDATIAEGTIRLTAALPQLTEAVSIIGLGASTLSIDGDGASRIFDIAADVAVDISGLTLTGGAAADGAAIKNAGDLTIRHSVLTGNVTSTGSGRGGGIFNSPGGTLVIDSSTLSGNSAQSGGAVYNAGQSLTINNSTISGNTAKSNGGGIANTDPNLTITNSTITMNRSNSDGDSTGTGGGIFTNVATATLNNTIVAENFHGTGAVLDDVSGSVHSSSSSNLIGVDTGLSGINSGAQGNQVGTSASPLDPMLTTLANHGGTTPTHALEIGSPAIDAGNNGIALDAAGGLLRFDQRGVGFERIFYGGVAPDTVDIGAFEAQTQLFTVTTLDDENNGGVDSLREAIIAANVNPGDDAIMFASHLDGTITLNGTQLPAIVGNVTITGPTTNTISISADWSSRHMTIGAGVTVSISNLTLIQGGNVDGGGSIINRGSLTISGSELSQNSAALTGGAISNVLGATLIINDTTISNNTAQRGGGVFNLGTVSIADSTLSSNLAEQGGGIFNRGTVNLTDTDFITNGAESTSTTDRFGGAIFNVGDSTLSGVTLTGNYAEARKSSQGMGRGGAIYDTGTLTIDNSTISTNTADQGGGIFSFGNVNITNSTFANNGAEGAWGNTLAEGLYTFSATAADSGGDTSLPSSEFTVTVDTTRPGLTSIERQTTSNAETDADEVTFRITFDEDLDPSSVDKTDFSLTGSAAADGVVSSVAPVSGTSLFDVTITGLTNSSGTVNLDIADGHNLKDIAGNALIDWGASPDEEYIIDNTKPTSPVLTGVTEDTGIAGDHVTSDRTLEISGTALVNSTVKVSRQGMGEIGQATANAAGAWIFDYTGTALGEGFYTFTATSTDGSGATSLSSIDFSVTIDETAPKLTSIERQTPSNAQTDADSVTFRVTFDEDLDPGSVDQTDFSLSGTVAGDGVLSSVSPVRGTSIYNVTVSGLTNSNGTMNLDIANGHDLKDVAGNALTDTAASPDEEYVLENTNLVASPVLLGITEDTGISGDRVTNDQTLEITGTAEPNSTVRVSLEGVGELGQTTADDSGQWSFDYTPTNKLGGAVYSGGHGNLTGVTFNGNNAMMLPDSTGIGAGGAVFTTSNAVFTIENSTISNGLAEDGGGIYNFGTLDLTDSEFTNNGAEGASTSAKRGGALFNVGTANLSEITLTGNHAKTLSTSSGTGFGGAIFNATDAIVLIETSSISNSTAGQGGGIFNAGTVNLIDSEFTNNAAEGTSTTGKLGGAVFNDNNATVTITISAISNNSSDEGGGIFNRGTVNLTDTEVTDNTAVQGGGIENFGSLHIVRSLLSDNTANFGAAVITFSTMSIENSTVTSNVAFVDGGGIYHFSGPSRIVNSSVTDNRARSIQRYGGGIRSDSDDIVLHNSIVAGNFHGTGTVARDISGNVDMSSSFNLIGVDSNLDGITNGTNNNQIGTTVSPIDPKLGPLQDNGGPTHTHALLAGSPAIDKGSNALANDPDGDPTTDDALTTDQRGMGFVRIENGGISATVDIGAFEVQQNSAPVLDASQSPTLAPIDEDATDPVGDTVSAIVVDDSITDPDGVVEAIAVTEVDDANGTWQFSIDSGTNWNAFGDVSTSNARLLAPDNKVRFFPNENFNGTASFTFRAWDQTSGTAGGTADTSSNGNTSPYSTATDSAEVTVNPVNDNPVITSNGADTTASVNVDENQTSVADVEATDVDGDTEGNGLTYSLTGGADLALFSIDLMGLLTFNSPPDFENPIDSNTDNVYVVQVTVTDSGGLTDVQEIAVTVDGVNDNEPEFTNDGGGPAAAVDAPEKQTTVTTVTATDEDLPAQTLTFSITGGLDQALFEIDSSSGVLTFDTAPDFENPDDDGANNIYDVQVTVTDNGSPSLANVQDISVTVTNENDSPKITSNGGGPSASVNVADNQTSVTTVTATDVDVPAQTLTYSISGGLDQALFSIDGSSGALTFNTAPDFENPSDNGNNNIYDVQVRVTDNGTPNLTDVQSIAVTVTNENDSPVITSDGSGPVAMVDAAENQTSVTTVTATDVDLPAQMLTFSISGGVDQALFSIDSSSGVLTFSTAPNFESPTDDDSNNVYEVQVTVTDNGTPNLMDAQDIAVRVTDENDRPAITSNGGGPSAAINASENQVMVTTVTATDPDLPAQTLTFSISGGPDQALFSIGDSTGVLTFKSAPDFESPSDEGGDNIYNLEVTVTDSGGLADVQAISVTVGDVDDVGPVLQNLSPPDNATDVAVNTNLVLTFNEDVTKGVGNILIKDSSDGVIVKAIPVGNATVSVAGNVVTVDPGVLASATNYYVEVSGSVFKDLAGNDFSGIAGPDGWNFATGNAPPARFQSLGDLLGGTTLSVAQDVSSDGSVAVGYSSSNVSSREAFRWTADSGLVGLGILPPRDGSHSFGVSPDGSIIAGVLDFGTTQAFRWNEQDGMTGLAGGITSSAHGAANDGTVVGQGYDGSSSRAVLWASGSSSMQILSGASASSSALGISADGTVIVGTSAVTSGLEAVRWVDGGPAESLGDLPGGAVRGSAMDLTPDGMTIVGGSESANGDEAFIWTELGGTRGLGDLAGGEFNSFAFDVSADGSIVVGRGTTSLGAEAFIWDALNGMRSLQTVLTDIHGLDLTGWQLRFATGVSSDGHAIVGYGTNPSGHTEAWRVEFLPAPEIGVSGNNINIVDGDATPEGPDKTDFGFHDVNSGSAKRTFTIENTGTDILHLTGSGPVEIIGSSAFQVTRPPTALIPAGGSTTFDVAFEPNSTGIHTATISIPNDDADENPYDFAIRGVGTSVYFDVDPADPNVTTADTTDASIDDGRADGIAEDANGNTSLRAAVMEANAVPGDNVIVLGPGTFPLDISATGASLSAEHGDLDIIDTTGSLTIRGAGANATTIEIASTLGNRAFRIDENVSVVLSNLTIKGLGAGGFLTGHGGAIQNAGHLVIRDSQIIQHAARYGGAIHNTATGTLELTRSAIHDNEATTSGGNGGGILNAGQLTITDSTISNNRAIHGGGIYTIGVGATKIERSTLDGNRANGGNGGGLLTGDPTTIKNSTISGNVAHFGGGVHVQGETTSVSNSTVTDNHAAQKWSAALNRYVGGGGGGINIADDSALHISSTIVAANSADPDPNQTAPWGPDGRKVPTATVVSLGHNLIGDRGLVFSTFPLQAGDLVGTQAEPLEPMLGPLADNGGLTRTHALRSGSPAMDAGSLIDDAVTDQRGLNRPQDGIGDGSVVHDIGAYESVLRRGWAASEGQDGLNAPSANDEFTSVAVDSVGNLIAGGSVYAAGNPGGDGKGDGDILIVKYDPLGDFLVSYQTGSPDDESDNRGDDDDRVLDVAVDLVGNVYAVGFFQNEDVDFDKQNVHANGEDALTSAGSRDGFLLKLDRDLNFQWVLQFGTSTLIWDYVSDIDVDSQGNVYIAGNYAVYQSAPLDFDPRRTYADDRDLKGQSSQGDGFVAKYNSDGDFQWVRTFGGSNHEYLQDVHVDSNGNVLVAGTFSGSGQDVDFDRTAESSGDKIKAVDDADTFILKLNGDGEFQWVGGIGGSGYQSARAIASDADGNLYVVGEYESVVDFDPDVDPTQVVSKESKKRADGAYTRDIFVLKLDASGDFVWVQTPGLWGTDASTDVTLDSNGNILVSGYFEATLDFDASENLAELTARGVDSFLWTIAPDNAFVDVRRYGGTGNERINNIAYDRRDAVAIAGRFEETGDAVDLSIGVGDEIIELVSNGGKDAFAALVVPQLDLSLADHTVSEATGPAATTATVTRTGNVDDPLTVSITNPDRTELLLPTRVIIPAGERQVTFDVETVNDGDLDGNQTGLVISATAPGFSETTDAIEVQDDDVLGNRTLGGHLYGTIPNDTYRVLHDVTVDVAQTLTIQAGSKLEFEPSTGLIVIGSLHAEGAAESMIVLTSGQQVPNPGDWKGIRISDSLLASYLSRPVRRLQNTEIAYADVGLTIVPGRSAYDTNTSIVTSEIHHNAHDGISVSAIEWGTRTPNSVRILDTYIHDNGGNGISVTGSDISSSTRNDTTVIGNEIAHNVDAGVHLSARTNVISLFGSAPRTSTVGGTIAGNYIHSNAYGIVGQARPGCRFGFGEPCEFIDTAIIETTIQNNLITSHSLDAITLSVTGPTHEMRPNVVNNTISDNGGVGLWHTSQTSTGFGVRNNIFANNDVGIAADTSYTPDADTVEHNLIFGNATAAFVSYPAFYGDASTTNGNGTLSDEELNIFVDPKFVSASDFHLTASSPAIDAGTSSGAPTDDFDGDIRGDGAVDIGYDEVANLTTSVVVGGATVSGHQIETVTGFLDVSLSVAPELDLELSGYSLAVEITPTSGVRLVSAGEAPNALFDGSTPQVFGTGARLEVSDFLENAGESAPVNDGVNLFRLDFEVDPGVGGEFELSVSDLTLTDANGDVVQSTDVINGSITVQLEGDSPRVSSVRFLSTSWSDLFPSSGGHEIPVESGLQLQTLSWINLDQIRITFTEDVQVRKDDFLLLGVNTPLYDLKPGSGIVGETGFHYDPATSTATWTLTGPIDADKLLVELSDTIRDLSGNAIDGDWTIGQSYPSGNDSPGGDFEFRVNVLPGDVTTDNRIFVDDVIRVRNNQFIFPNNPLFDPKIDVNGDGRIFVDDVIAVRNRQFVFLPPGEPQGQFHRLLNADDRLPSHAMSAGQVTANAIEVHRAAAIAAWLSTGIEDHQAAKLAQAEIRIGYLSHGRLGLVTGDVIVVDIDASGSGWFIDTTPFDHSEFRLQADGSLKLSSTNEDGTRPVDLLTVLTHELGHLLGYEDLDLDHGPMNAMSRRLGAGTRLLPIVDANVEAQLAVGKIEYGKLDAIMRNELNGQRVDLFFSDEEWRRASIG